MHSLTAEEVERFRRDGFLTPRRVFSPATTTELRAQLESMEARFGDQAVKHRTDLHLIQRWAWDVVHEARIVDPVADLLGGNVLLWSLNWFIKEKHDHRFVSYHQDATYWGLEPHDVVTAWLALSDASAETGPMRFVRGSHKLEIFEHQDTFADDNLLSRGQVIQTEIDESAVVDAPLQAGEMSLHHVRLIHGSQPNQTADRRIGMVLRYCATHVKQTKVRDTAVLVKGRDNYGHFDLLPAPRKEFGAREMAHQRDALKRMNFALHSKDREHLIRRHEDRFPVI